MEQNLLFPQNVINDKDLNFDLCDVDGLNRRIYPLIADLRLRSFGIRIGWVANILFLLKWTPTCHA